MRINTFYGKQARHIAVQAVYKAAQVMNPLADLINAAIEELIHNRYELPAFWTLNRIAQRVHGITVSHYPSGASKWNPIEHRLFSQISKNWEAEPLDSYEKALKFIRTTTTKTGLKVIARLDTTYYPTGVKVPKRDLAQLSIQQKRVLLKWNYTISPQM